MCCFPKTRKGGINLAGIEGFADTLYEHRIDLYVAQGLCGIYIGALPGLSVTMAFSLLLSFTYSWNFIRRWLS
jgi:putative tricarboxylic transport membrane protein